MPYKSAGKPYISAEEPRVSSKEPSIFFGPISYTHTRFDPYRHDKDRRSLSVQFQIINMYYYVQTVSLCDSQQEPCVGCVGREIPTDAGSVSLCADMCRALI